MPVFEKLLHDEDEKVRMEAPEIFRVLGKRRPEFVRPYVEELQRISETDDNRVVRIHCQGAIKALEPKSANCRGWSPPLSRKIGEGEKPDRGGVL
jgi:HEAT repeat protein